jgi:Transcriptional regulators
MTIEYCVSKKRTSHYQCRPYFLSIKKGYCGRGNTRRAVNLVKMELSTKYEVSRAVIREALIA